MPSERDDRDATASRFVATLGATVAAANHPVTMVGEVMAKTALACGLDHQFWALPNYVYVEVGSPSGEGLYIVNPTSRCATTSHSRSPSRLHGRRQGRSIPPRESSNSTESRTAESVGVQTGLLLWRAAIQLSGTPHRRAMHD